MKIHLDSFEEQIEEVILQRGLNYFEKGYVVDFQEISQNQYEALVEGSENYTVQFTVKNRTITQYTCDCPYDMGNVCKHIVAAIFYLEQEILSIEPKTKKIHAKKLSAQKPKTKKKTIAEQVKDILKQVSHEELMDFIENQTISDRNFRNLFLTSFAQYQVQNSKQIYNQQLKSMLKSLAGRDRFIYRPLAKQAYHTVENLLQIASKCQEKQAIWIYTAIMEEMVKALEFADDSDAHISGGIDISYQKLLEIAQNQPKEEIRRMLLDYAFHAFQQKLFEDWDWHTRMLELASWLVSSPQEMEQLLEVLTQTSWSEYEIETIQLLKYNVLLKLKGQNEASKFIEKHINNPKIRDKALEIAFLNKNYTSAISIAKQGMQYDAKRRPGLVSHWCEWLLKIAQEQNDVVNIIDYAQHLLILNFHPEQDHFEILKNHVARAKWTSFLEEIIEKIQKKNHFTSEHLIRSIYVKEQWWDKLLLMLEENLHFQTLEFYEPYLIKTHQQELVCLYQKAIFKFMSVNQGRKEYKKICKFLKKMMKWGASDAATEIAQTLRKQYPKRVSLLDELANIKL